MSKSAVRQAIANFLDPNISGVSIEYLSNVYQALPKIANEQDLFSLQPPGQGLGAVIFMFLGHQVEKLLTVPAIGGQRQRTYTLDLLCILKSDVETTLAGQQAFDSFMDSLIARILSDPQAGDPSLIVAWGQGDMRQGSLDMEFEYPVPKVIGGGVVLFQAVGHITVVELVIT